MEQHPPGSLPLGAAEIARNVEFSSTQGPRTRPGYKRLVAGHTDPTAIKLDGNHHCIVIDPTDTGGLNVVMTNNFMLVFQFQIRAPEPGITNPGTYLWDYSEGETHTDNLRVFIQTQNGEFRFFARVSDSAGSASLTAGSSIPIQLGKFYTGAVRYGGSAGTENLEVRIFGEEDWQASAGTQSGDVYAPTQINTEIHVHVGGITRQVSNLDDGTAASRLLRCSAINMHRIRIWDDPNNNLDPDTSETPEVDYRFTERGGTTFSDSISAAPDARLVDLGQHLFSTGADRVAHRSSALWNTSSPLTGFSSLDFDGYAHFLSVPNAVRYRKVQGDGQNEDDDDLKTFPELGSFGVVALVQFDIIRDLAIAQSVPVRENPGSGNPNDASPDYYWLLHLERNSGNPRICWSVGQSASSDYSIHTDPLNITISTGTTYLILATRDVVEGEMTLRVTTVSSDWDEEVVDSSAPTTTNDVVAGNEGDRRANKYALVLGCMVEHAVFNPGDHDPNDPNDFSLRLNYLRQFKGTMGCFGVLGLERETDGSGTIPKEVVLSLIDKQFTTNEITEAAAQYRFLSLWFFDEGSGDEVIDSGLLGQSIPFIDFPDRGYVRSQVGYTLEEADPPSIDAVTEVFDDYKPRRVVAISGASAYEVDVDNEQYTFIADGFRNDSSNKVFTFPYRRDTLFTAGNKPFRLHRDDIFPLGVETLKSDKIRFGLINQLMESGQLGSGLYRYRFVYYSKVTDEEGDYDGEVQVRIPARNNANVAFGATVTNDSITDREPKIYVNQRPARRDAPSLNVKAGIFDITDGVTDWTNCVFTIQVEGGGPPHSSQDRTQKISIERKDVDDPEGVLPDELARVIRFKTRFLRVGTTGDNYRLRFISSVVGNDRFDNTDVSGAKMTFFKESSLGATESDLFEVLSFPGTEVSDTGTDGGQSTQPLPLPEASPQVTHIRVYRTAANGDTFRFVGEVPIGEAPDGYAQGRYLIDDVSDDDLSFNPPMLDQSGSIPDATMMAELSGFVFYAGDADRPERLYFAQGAPHRVAPVNFVDILEGHTRAITGLQRYSSGLLIFKEHATFVLTFTSSPVLPFRIEMRKPDVGCLGPFGVENVRDRLYVADPQFPRMFDSLNYADTGYNIHDSWTAVSESTGRDIFALHWRREKMILFADSVNNQAFVVEYQKNAWSKWTGFPFRTGVIAIKDNRLDTVIFGDQYGNCFEISPDEFSDGTNWVTDASKVNESVTGTGFTVVSTTEITLTDWDSIDENDGQYVRGLRLYLDDLTDQEEGVVVRTNSSGNLILETALSDIAVGAYSSGTWQVGRIDSEFRSGGIRAAADEYLQVFQWMLDMERESGWPTGYDITLTSFLRSGVAASGELTKVVKAVDEDMVIYFPFGAREFRWGIRSQGPNVPFSVSSIGFDVDQALKSRPF